MLNKVGILNKFSMVLVGTLALAMTALASPAMAQTFSPAPNTFMLTGVLNLQQSININCDVKINVSVDAAGVATVTSQSFSATSAGTSPLCGTAVTPFGTWTLTPNSPTQVTSTVGATSVLGTCVGAVLGTWDNATSTLTFINAIVPGAPGPCIVNGTLTSSDPTVQII